MQGIGIAAHGCDRLVPLAAVAKELGFCTATVHKWVREGSLPRHGGPRIRLEALKVGGRFFTTPARLRRFLDLLNASPTQTESERTAATQVAMQELEAAGY